MSARSPFERLFAAPACCQGPFLKHESRAPKRGCVRGSCQRSILRAAQVSWHRSHQHVGVNGKQNCLLFWTLCHLTEKNTEEYGCLRGHELGQKDDVNLAGNGGRLTSTTYRLTSTDPSHAVREISSSVQQQLQRCDMEDLASLNKPGHFLANLA